MTRARLIQGQQLHGYLEGLLDMQAVANKPLSSLKSVPSGSAAGISKSDSKAASRPSLVRCNRATPSTGKGKQPQAQAVSSTPIATVDLSGLSPVQVATTGSKQRWLGKAGNLLHRWTVPLKVKKEKDNKDNSKGDQSEVIVID